MLYFLFKSSLEPREIVLIALDRTRDANSSDKAIGKCHFFIDAKYPILSQYRILRIRNRKFRLQSYAADKAQNNE